MTPFSNALHHRRFAVDALNDHYRHICPRTIHSSSPRPVRRKWSIVRSTTRALDSGIPQRQRYPQHGTAISRVAIKSIGRLHLARIRRHVHLHCGHDNQSVKSSYILGQVLNTRRIVSSCSFLGDVRENRPLDELLLRTRRSTRKLHDSPLRRDYLVVINYATGLPRTASAQVGLVNAPSGRDSAISMASTASPKAVRQADGTAFAASAAGPSSRAPPKVTPVPIPKPGSLPSAPGQPSQPSPNPAAPVAKSNEPVRQSTTPAPSTAAAGSNRDVSLPLIQDGRVRSPMPGKLKGKLDQKKGMFGVMLMAGPTTSDINKRDAEAKRASESTKLAAEQAAATRPRTVRGRMFVRLPPDPAPTTSPPVPPAQAPAPPSFSGFTDAGIKQEQARLLTVLRSLNPVTVVDQICTALAFFGGIPGAPPPPDGAFPPSAMANGSGRLFVSWIAEIFPPVPNYGPPGPPVAEAPPRPEHVDLTQQTMQEGGRKRGRPKGSKSSRPRKDKGIKKGPAWARPEPVSKPKSGRPVGRPRKSKLPGASNTAEESWVDVDQDEEGHEGDDAELEQQQASPPPSAPGVDQEVPPTVRTALPSGSQGAEGQVMPRKRGRPKGAKTRAPRASATGSVPASGNTQAAPVPQPAPSPAVAQAAENASFTPVNSLSAAQTGSEAAAQPDIETQKKGARTKGPRNKSKAQQPASVAGANALPPVAGTAAASDNPGQPTPYGEQPLVSYAAATAKQSSQAISLALPQSPPSASAANTPAQPSTAARKRKRQSKRDAEAGGQQALESANLALPSGTGIPDQQPAGTSGMNLAPPRAKRQRKSKDTTGNAKSNANPSANTSSKADGHLSVAGTPAAPDAARGSYGHTFDASSQASADDPLTLDVDRAISSLQSPHDDSHFDVESPTMENYQAQLQAQLEQESASKLSPAMQQTGAQSHVDARQLMANRLQQQQYQQNQYQQRQQRTQQPPLRVPQGSAAHAGSPSFQQQAPGSQQESPRPSRPAPGASQGNFQYRSTGPQFSNSAQQAAQSQLTQNSQSTQGQQYPTATQQYNTAQQQYPTGQSQYPNPGNQQQGTAQSHYPQQLVTAGGASSYTASQSPQFTPTSNPNYHASANFNPSYNNPLQHGLTANSAANGYGSASAQNSRSPSTFDSSSAPSQAHQQQQHQRTSSSTSSHSLQNPALQPFAAGDNTAAAAGWDLFDAAAAGQGSQAAYGMAGGGGGGGTATSRSAAPGGSGFPHSPQGGMGDFDASGGGYWKR